MLLVFMLYKVDLTFETLDGILKCDIQMKVIDQHFPVVMFIMQCRMVLTVESVDEILKCDNPDESY